MGQRQRLAVVVVALASAGALAQCGDDGNSAEGNLPLPDRRPLPGGDAEAGGDPGCDPHKPFGAPTLVPGLDDGMFYAVPRLTPDELSIEMTTILVADGAAQADLVRATRPSRSAPFDPVTPIASHNTPHNENDPMVAADLLSRWFSSSRTGEQELYVAKRASAAEAFGPAILVPGLSAPTQEMHPYYRVAAQELWFTSDRDGSFDIYVSTLQADAAFALPAAVPELSTAALDAHPALTEDGLDAILTSDRDGGAGGFDLWAAHRTSTAEAFAPPVPLAELNTSANEYAGWMSPDRCRVYFSSDREAEAGPRHRIWYAERAR